MNIEQQVVSLELAKKMKKLGFEQESIYHYCHGHIMYDLGGDGLFEECTNEALLDEGDLYCHTAELVCEDTLPAYTVAELGEFIPVDTLNLYIYRRGDMTAGDTRAWTCELRDVVGIIIRT